MPRQARFTIDNGIYHVMIRGNNRANLFHEEDDFRTRQALSNKTIGFFQKQSFKEILHMYEKFMEALF